jgi:uncharacterized protein YeaO (DUF488 family)
MTLRIVRLGTPRIPDEGTRIGTVRRLPRGVRKERYAADDWFDVWYPDLAPSPELLTRARAAKTDKEWNAFLRSFRAEMTRRRRGEPSICSRFFHIMRISQSVATAKTNRDVIARFSANFLPNGVRRSSDCAEASGTLSKRVGSKAC